MRRDEKLIGAAMERKAILRHIRREQRGYMTRTGHEDGVLGRLQDWILDRDKRYKARKDGL